MCIGDVQIRTQVYIKERYPLRLVISLPDFSLTLVCVEDRLAMTKIELYMVIR